MKHVEELITWYLGFFWQTGFLVYKKLRDKIFIYFTYLEKGQFKEKEKGNFDHNYLVSFLCVKPVFQNARCGGGHYLLNVDVTVAWRFALSSFYFVIIFIAALRRPIILFIYTFIFGIISITFTCKKEFLQVFFSRICWQSFQMIFKLIR